MNVTYANNSVFQSFYANRRCSEEKINSKGPRGQKNNKGKIAACALMGAIIPVAALNIKKGRGDEFVSALKNKGAKETVKSACGLFEIDSFKGIVSSNAGAVLAGTTAGILTDKNKENRKTKCEEGIFEFLNGIAPTCVAAIGEATGKFKSVPARAALVAGSVASGMFFANKTSNKINETCFEDDRKRKFKLSDCLVHLDDMLGILVIAKVPFAKALNVDKILPLLYARAGYEAGSADDTR